MMNGMGRQRGRSRIATLASFGLTFDWESQCIALALSLDVSGQASVDAGCLAIDPLQH